MKTLLEQLIEKESFLQSEIRSLTNAVKEAPSGSIRVSCDKKKLRLYYREGKG